MSPRPSRRPPPDLGHTPTATVNGRTIVAGDEVTVRLPGAATRQRCRFLHTDRTGAMTLVDSEGRARSIRPEAVHTVHRSRKIPRRGHE